MNTALAKKLHDLPRSPGVYFHKSKTGEVIYVGKAAVLKNRVRQYFQASRNLDAKTMALVAEVDDTDWVETESEIDALFLESEMVKRYMPRYNVLLRDDKSQLYVRINMKSEWPHVSFTRNPSDDGAEYLGPFYNGFALKKSLRYLRQIFPYYTKPPEKVTSKLETQLRLSPNQAEGSAVYKANLKKLISYIKGNRQALLREFEAEMKKAAQAQDYETAVDYRNKLRFMSELKRRIMFGDREFLDISKDKALGDLSTILGLGTLKRIEGYDISHQGGTNVVASMVVFTNGVSDRSNYRKFKMTWQTNDDTGQMYETLYRRLGPKNLKSWGTPELILIDGGKGQLRAGLKAQRDRGTKIPMISIAKRDEEVIVHEASNVDIAEWQTTNPPGVSATRQGEFTIINLHVGQRNLGSHTMNLRGESTLSPYSDVVKLFQRIRDESHRFAVSYHTALKRTSATQSSLEAIPGIGPATRKKLLKHFGSLRGVVNAEERELARVVGAAKAEQIRRHTGQPKQD